MFFKCSHENILNKLVNSTNQSQNTNHTIDVRNCHRSYLKIITLLINVICKTSKGS